MFKRIGRFLSKRSTIATILAIAATLVTGGSISVVSSDANPISNGH